MPYIFQCHREIRRFGLSMKRLSLQIGHGSGSEDAPTYTGSEHTLTGSNDFKERGAMSERLLFYVAVAAVVVVLGFLAMRLWNNYIGSDGDVPAPIKIFRSPNNADFS
jgi:hypothetical protein